MALHAEKFFTAPRNTSDLLGECCPNKQECFFADRNRDFLKKSQRPEAPQDCGSKEEKSFVEKFMENGVFRKETA